MQPTDKGTYFTFKSLLITALKVRVNENWKSQAKGGERLADLERHGKSDLISESSVDLVQAS